MGAVFVSYRRGDSEGQARALSLELERLLGKDAIFMDVDGIALGRDFRQVVQERLGSCDVMLALIGPGWLDAKDGRGQRRLDTPTDFVRQEIAAALKRNIPVIPVLVQGAQIPQPEQLPDDLKDLPYRNAFELDHTTWESDVREMVKRLGLSATSPSPSPSPTPPIAAHAPAAVRENSPPSSWHRYRIPAVIAVVIGAVMLLGYFKPGMNKDDGPEAPKEGAVVSTPVPNMAALPAPSPKPGAALVAAGLDFAWPGGDCWDIFRGAELVTTHCGAASQALSAGRYTIKGKYAPVFLPFEVDVKGGAPTKIALGGVFEFTWPGTDCWDIMRGDEIVQTKCGTDKQAVSAGRYTIKGKYAAVFPPFTIDVKDGFSTKVAKGGVFEFAWPGNDCWDIVRGEELVASHCGKGKQAVAAGRYTIKGKYKPVFNPFEITIEDGKVVKAP